MTNATRTPAAPAVVAAYGSKVIAALEGAWAALQANHPDLPDVVIITSTGHGQKWGHTHHQRWTAAPVPVTGLAQEPDGDRRMTEVFIAGERLACGATDTFQTMVHEAAHVLADARGVKDTSRNNQYHNRKFVDLATELGLHWPAGREPDKVIGFSAVELTEETADRYSDQIHALAESIQLYLALPSFLVALLGLSNGSAGRTGTDGGQSGGGAGTGGLTVPPRKPRGTAKNRNNPVASCGCDTPRTLRISRKMLDLGDITCGLCGDPFAIREVDGEEA